MARWQGKVLDKLVMRAGVPVREASHVLLIRPTRSEYD